MTSRRNSIAARAIAYARRWPGLTGPEIVDALGLPEAALNAVYVGLGRAVAAGYVRTEGRTYKGRTYHPTDKPWQPGTRKPHPKAAQMVAMREAGFRDADIMRTLRVAPQTLAKYLKGVPSARERRHAEVLRLRGEDPKPTLHEIADRVGMHWQTVGRIIRAAAWRAREQRRAEARAA